MNTNKFIALTLTLSALIAILSGCSGAGKYTDDVARYADDVAKKARGASDEIGDNAIRKPDNSANELVEIAKSRLEGCATDTAKSALEETVKTAISSGYTQVSVEALLNISKNAIQEGCPEVAIGTTAYNYVLQQSADSSVGEVMGEYQGQIEFVSP